jgi:hypothetical protein
MAEVFGVSKRVGGYCVVCRPELAVQL